MKSRGAQLVDVVRRHWGVELDEFENMPPSYQLRWDQAAAEYDKATSALPEDVEAFVQEVEARANKATPGPWWTNTSDPGCVRAAPMNWPAYMDITESVLPDNAAFIANARTDVPRLVAIVREQGAELSDMRAKRQSVVDGMTRAISAEGEANRAYYSVCAERDALRERLAKLEAALDRTNKHLYDEGISEGCECCGCCLYRENAELLNEKGGA